MTLRFLTSSVRLAAVHSVMRLSSADQQSLRLPSMVPTRLIAVAALLLWVSPLQSAGASALNAPAKAVFGSPSLPCMAQGSRLMQLQLVQAAPDAIMERLRLRLGKSVAWKKGTPSYEAVRSIVLEAMNANAAGGVPPLTFSVDGILNDVAARWTPDEQRRYAAFFARPAGKLFLSDMVDGAACIGVLKVVDRPPLGPLSAGDKVLLDALLASRKGAEDSFIRHLGRLSKDEQDRFAAEMPALFATFRAVIDAQSKAGRANLARVEKILAARMSEIRKAADLP